VGLCLLDLLPDEPCRLIAVTDSTATVCARAGLGAAAIAAHKRSGRALREWPNAEAIPAVRAISTCGADIVADATPSSEAGTAEAVQRGRAALQRGATLVLCGKNALAAAAAEWLLGGARGRVGINAVLGGAGQQLVRDLDELRAGCRSVALAGNVTTTVIVQAIERGAAVADGIEHARALGLLEPDPALDLDGSDAAKKLAIVAGAVFGEPSRPAPRPESIRRDDVRDLDADLVRARARRGASTRLVARADRTGALQVLFEEVAPGSPLCAPPDRVVYTYELGDGTLRVHCGFGVGYEGTAAAMLADLRAAAVSRAR
jgi:homoserine dehydrogenase